MLTANRDLMTQARGQLAGNWGVCVVVTLIFIVISALPNSLKNIGGIVSLILSGPLTLGMVIFYLRLVREKRAPEVGVMFGGFKSFGRALVAQLLVILYVVLWALLLIVPGIMAVFGYAMTFFILADNPEMKPADALKKSKEMMRGSRLKLFYLGCRFIGWALLGIVTLGIGLLWVFPYMYTSFTGFYLDLKQGSAAQPQAAPAVS
jgi:uncharacterized membrane protein